MPVINENGTPQESAAPQGHIYDMIIVGGGPGGYTAALYAARAGLDAVVLERMAAGGQMALTEQVDNYPGFDEGVDGFTLGEKMRRGAERFGVPTRMEEVTSLALAGPVKRVETGGGPLLGRTVVLSTGATPRKLELPGEEELAGQGVHYCAACDGMFYRGKPVAVVGLAPDAPAEANYLKSLGCQVVYVSPHRPEGLDGDIPVVRSGAVAVQGEQTVTGLEAGGTVLPCNGVFILRRAVAPTDLLPNLETADGAIQVDRSMATNVSGVFAAGDCTGGPLQVSKAVGEGHVAALSACAYLDRETSRITTTEGEKT